MNKFSIFNFQFSILIIMIFLIAMPIFASAEGLIPCKNSVNDPCEFADILTLIHNVTTFILVKLSIPIGAIMFAYAGFLFVVPGGESASARTKAKGIFWNVVVGLLFVAGAWLIVDTLLGILGYSSSWILHR